jgi:uncharacterized membrane protein YdjX (TVP38/TMEM64 family)
MIDDIKNLASNSKTMAISIIIASTLLVGIILVALIKFFNLQDHITAFLVWIDSIGVWGPLIFILTDILVVIFLFPGILITMGAGFIFGIIPGSIYIVIATTIGACISFMLSRYIFNEKFSNYFTSHKKAQYLNAFLAKDGWKIIFFTRLIPFFPFKLSNYLFGLTSFKAHSFIIGTFLGVWPITVFNVYIGSLAANLSLLGEVPESNNTQLYFYVFGLICAIAAITYITRRASLALNQYLSAQNDHK